MRMAATPSDRPRSIGAPVEGTRSQTLHRGLALLELVAETPLSLPDVVRLLRACTGRSSTGCCARSRTTASSSVAPTTSTVEGWGSWAWPGA